MANSWQEMKGNADTENENGSRRYNSHSDGYFVSLKGFNCS